MLYTICIALILIASVLIILAVLVQKNLNDMKRSVLLKIGVACGALAAAACGEDAPRRRACPSILTRRSRSNGALRTHFRA